MRADLHTVQACEVRGGEELHDVDGGSSCAALPLRAAMAAIPQRMARASTVGGSTLADDEIRCGGKRWITRPADVEEMTNDPFLLLGTHCQRLIATCDLIIMMKIFEASGSFAEILHSSLLHNVGGKVICWDVRVFSLVMKPVALRRMTCGA